MSWWEGILLGLIQGLAEFLPISSSGHLVLAQYVLGIEGTGDITFEVFVHFGTTMSILTVYRDRIIHLMNEGFYAIGHPSKWRERFAESSTFRMMVFILITLIPTGLAYVFFGDVIEATFVDPRFTCAMLLVTGTLLILTLLRRQPEGDIGPLKAFVTGVAQAFAMLPGISRSGATICTALYQKIEPKKAADFSFLMLFPVVIGATLLKTIDMFQGEGLTTDATPLILGTVVAYVSGIVAIKLVIDFVQRGNLHYFAFYCYGLGILGLLLI